MRWFSSKAKNVSPRPNRRKQSLLGFEQMEDRVCLTATAVVADTDASSECGVEDDVNQVSYGCEDWGLFWDDASSAASDSAEVLLSDNGTPLEFGGIEGSDIGSGGTTSDPQLDTMLVSAVDDEPLETAGIESSDIGSDPQLDTKLVTAVDDEPLEAGGIEGSDIGSGGTTSDPELDTKLVTSIDDKPLEAGGIEGTDIGSGGATSDPEVDEFDSKVRR